MRLRSLPLAGVLALLFLLALVLRGLLLYVVFPPDGSVVLWPADGSYHARKAFFSFVHFPAVLWFDSYLNYPDGSPVPWPPGYDWLLAAVARLFGTSQGVFERVVAWASPVLGALTVIPVYAVGRKLGGRGLGLAAAAIFAVLPASVLRSTVGNPDHHAAVGLLEMLLLLLSLELVSVETSRRRLAICGAAWAAAWVAMLLTWQGSLFYVVLVHGLVGIAGVLGGRRPLLHVQATVALATAAAVTPVVAASTPILGGPFSTITLSWVHVAALVGVALVAEGVVVLEGWRPAPGPGARALRAALLAGGLLLAVLAIPAVREALEPAARLFSKQDEWNDRVIEGRSLFEMGGDFFVSPSQSYGLFVYLLPLVLVSVWARARERRVREPALVFAAWATSLGFLAVHFIRFQPDFAPLAAVAFAVSAWQVHGWLARRWPPRRRLAAVACVLTGALLFAPVAPLYATGTSRSLARLRGLEVDASDNAGLQALDRFARSLRTVTPETEGFLDPDGRPEYGILVRPTLGHAVKWLGRRPVPADPFGPHLHETRLGRVRAFFETRDEEEAVAIARSLGARYVLTAAFYDALDPTRVVGRLHAGDGRPLPSRGPLQSFRLVAEGPEVDTGPGPVPGGAVYKLFEVVPGAVLDVRAGSDTRVSAELRLRTPLGRSVRWTARTRTGDDGAAELRVPYPTTPGVAPVGAEGPLLVHIGDGAQRVDVSEADVREGRRIRVVQGEPPL